MIIHKNKITKVILGTVYLPGTFYLSYTWHQASKFVTFDKLDTTKLYFEYENGKWNSWVIGYKDKHWSNLGYSGERISALVIKANTLYTTEIPKLSKITDYNYELTHYLEGVFKSHDNL